MSEQSVSVRRTTGFVRHFEFVAEVTARTADGGMVTVREFGHTESGATQRAQMSLRSKLTSRRRACGFMAEGFREEKPVKQVEDRGEQWACGFGVTGMRDRTRNKATFKFGFA
jgi:hypothetical protein